MKLLTLLFSLCVLATGSIETPQDRDPSARIGEIIKQAAIKLQESASRRPFKIKVMNDSLEKTAEAMRFLASRPKPQPEAAPVIHTGPLSPVTLPAGAEAPKEALNLLEEARRIYPENSFAALARAITLNAAGSTAEANQAFEDYLLASRTFTDFDREFLRWNDFHTLRRYAYEILRSRGVDFENRENQIQVRRPYEQLIHYVTHPQPQDRILNLFFIAVLLGGGVLLVLAAMGGMEFYRSLGFCLLAMYLAVWLAYGFWIFDLAFGLPWGLNRYTTSFILLGLGLIVGAAEMVTSWRDSHRPVEDGYKRCESCGEINVSLSVECFRCKKPF